MPPFIPILLLALLLPYTTAQSCTLNFNGASLSFAACRTLPNSGSRMQLYWTVNRTSATIDTVFRARDTGYVAFSWGYTTMISTTPSIINKPPHVVAIAMNSPSRPIADTYILTSYMSSDVQPAPTSLKLPTLTVASDDGFLSARFTRSLAKDPARNFNSLAVDAEVPAIWALGATPDAPENLKRHTARGIVKLALREGIPKPPAASPSAPAAPTAGAPAAPVQPVATPVPGSPVEGPPPLAESQDVTSASPALAARKRRYRAHGALMITAWTYVAPLAVIVMRYGKRWNAVAFQMHRGMNLIMTICAVVGLFLVAFSSSHSKRAHQFIGYVAVALAVGQIGVGVVRPKEGTKFRGIWYMLHLGIGMSAVVLGVVNVYIGVDLYQVFVPDGGTVWWIVPSVGAGVSVALWLVLALMRGKFPVRVSNDELEDVGKGVPEEEL